MAEALIPKHGGYRRLKSFQVAELVYDVTARFCDRCIDRCSRTHDQMVQAARSGIQNIVGEVRDTSLFPERCQGTACIVHRCSERPVHRSERAAAS